jgi:hypothetical protein
VRDPEVAQIDRTPGASSSDMSEELRVLVDLDLAGLSSDVTSALVATAMTHLHPLSPRAPFRDLVRRALEGAIRVPVGWSTPRRLIALVGSPGVDVAGVAAGLCRAYSEAGLSVGAMALADRRYVPVLAAGVGSAVDGVRLAESPEDVERRYAWTRELQFVVAVCPPILTGDRVSLNRAAELLDGLAPSETFLVLPADVSAGGARDAVDVLRSRVRVAGLVADGVEPVSTLGGVVSTAVALDLSIPWLVSRDGAPTISAADPRDLAARCLP